MSRVARPSSTSSSSSSAPPARPGNPSKLKNSGPVDDHFNERPNFDHKLTSAAAAGVSKPAGVPVSAFDAGRLAKPPRKPRTASAPLDVDALVIETGVPIPPARRPTRGSSYDAVLRRLRPGQSIVLTHQHAKALKARGKKLHVNIAVRVLPGSDQARAWRLADDDATKNGARP